jgi:UDPglucose 6-dehydrogenase/UDP-N-acetyl-D-galactosamine dehydrogenase
VHRARQLGLEPQVITAGREVNDGMPAYIAGLAIKEMVDAGKIISGSRVLIMGLTYKENVADTRETPVKGIIQSLKNAGIHVYGFDPYLSKDDITQEFDIHHVKSLDHHEGFRFNAVILTVAHDSFKNVTLEQLVKIQDSKPILFDIRRLYKKDDARASGIRYMAL